MFVMIHSWSYSFSVLIPLYHSMGSAGPGAGKNKKQYGAVIFFLQMNTVAGQLSDLQWQCVRTSYVAHTGLCRFRRPKAWAPTLVGTKLLCPSPPDRLRKSAKRWVTQVAVLHPRFCAVALLRAMQREGKQ